MEAVGRHLTPEEVKSRSPGLWRWGELLPVRDGRYRLSLGEGDTPILPASRLGDALNLAQVYLKDESRNPTGTFKARGLAVAVSRAIELGVNSFAIPTAGNAGGALAAYAARADREAHVFMPAAAPRVNQVEVSVAGASLHLVDGTIDDAARQLVEHKPSQPDGQPAEPSSWFDVSTFKEPYRLEGKKTMGFEIAEAFSWQLPDVILYPTGGGTGLVGIWKAFAELETLGWISDKRPRMVAVQAENCAPIVRAFQHGAKRAKSWENARTIASGLCVPSPFADALILDVLYASQGEAIAVSDEEITAAQNKLARLEGILAAPEAAATQAALEKLVAQGWLTGTDCVLLLITGSGLKYLQ
jgi:threonine synthase